MAAATERAGDAATTSSAAGSGKPNLELKKWNAVALWSWDIVVDYCAICRNHIMHLCIECQAASTKNSNEQCSVSWGACSHAFHQHCITRWLNTRKVCPLDSQEWVYVFR